MCHCKKNGRLKKLLKKLEGFFECIGSPQNNSIVSYEEVYGDLLTPLYQLDDDGNKVIVDWDTEANGFIIDVNRPVYIGALRDNSDSNFVTTVDNGRGNSYNDIVKYGFKPTIHEFVDKNKILRSFVIDAAEDSVLPISYDKDTDVCRFDNNIRVLCLPKVNFYIYPKYDREGVNYSPEYSGYYGIKREVNGYWYTGNYEYPFEREDTKAVDEYGNIIQRDKASVLMLPIHNDTNGEFWLMGHSDGKYGDNYNLGIEKYKFDTSVSYGEEVNAHGISRGIHDIVHVNFVNADSNHADLVPTDSCQFLSSLRSGNGGIIPFGTKWDCELNDIYCDVTTNIGSDNSFSFRVSRYKSDIVRVYIQNSVANFAYNTKHLDNTKDMYLYNLDTNYNLDIKEIGDSITIPVKRLPVLDLSGILNISDFDSTKEYIYIAVDRNHDGFYLTKYSEFSNDIQLQLVDNFMDIPNHDTPTNLSKERYIDIYCASEAPDEYGVCRMYPDNSKLIYRITCPPTEMNEEVQYTFKKMN